MIEFKPYVFAALAILSAGVVSAEVPWKVIHEDIPETAVRYVVTLQFEEESSRANYHSGPLQFETSPIPGNKQEDGFNRQVDLWMSPEGWQYRVWIGDEPNDVNFIGTRDIRLMEGRIFREKEGKKEVLQEGLLSLSSPVAIPVPLPGSSVGRPDLDTVEAQLHFNINSWSNETLRGQWGIHYPGSLKGTRILDEATLSVTVNPLGEWQNARSALLVSVDWFQDGLLDESVRGRMNDVLDLGPARLAATRIAEDFSKIELAVLNGELKPRAFEAVSPGEKLPPFSRVDLFRREMVGLGDLLDRVGDDGWLVMVFGNEPNSDPQNMYRGQPSNQVELPMSTEAVVQSLGVNDMKPTGENGFLFVGNRDNDNRVILAIVSTRVDLSALYAYYLGTQPPYYLLSDPSDPTAVQFGMNQNQSYYQAHQRKETLRKQFKLPASTTSALLIDSDGNLADVETNASDSFAETLSRFRMQIEAD